MSRSHIAPTLDAQPTASQGVRILATIRHDMFEVECYSYKALAQALKVIHTAETEVNIECANLTYAEANKAKSALFRDLIDKLGDGAPLETSADCAIGIRHYTSQNPNGDPFSPAVLGIPNPQSNPEYVKPTVQSIGVTPKVGFIDNRPHLANRPDDSPATHSIVANYHWVIEEIKKRWLAHMPDYPNSPHIGAIAKILTEMMELPETLERSQLYQTRMAAISSAALGYCPDPAKVVSLYITTALHDVKNLYRRYASAEQKLVTLQKADSAPGQSAEEALADAYEQRGYRELESRVKTQAANLEGVLKSNELLSEKLNAIFAVARKHEWTIEQGPFHEVLEVWLSKYVECHNAFHTLENVLAQTEKRVDHLQALNDEKATVIIHQEERLRAFREQAQASTVQIADRVGVHIGASTISTQTVGQLMNRDGKPRNPLIDG